MTGREHWATKLDVVFRKLDQVDAISELNTDDSSETEARVLAYSLVEIAESCQRFVKELNALIGGSRDEVVPHLEELREELRHIQYHIRDSRFLRVIGPSVEERDPEG